VLASHPVRRQKGAEGMRNSNRKDKVRTNTHTRAFHVLAKMRRDKLSLAEACRLEHIKPSTFLRHVGSAVQQDRSNGRYRATEGDKFRRDLQIPTALGPTSVPIYGSKNATQISQYLNAIALYLRKGDISRLERFQGKIIRVRGQNIELITDPKTLTSLALAGALHFDQLYASIAGAA
jgi:hypothetical protein